METIYVNKYAANQSSSSFLRTLTDDIFPFFATRLGQYNNLAYLEMATESTALRDAVFSIGSNEFYRLAIGNPVNQNNANIDAIPYLRDAASTTAQVNNKHLGVSLSAPSARVSWPQGNSFQYSFYLYTISDTNGNLEVIWTPNPTYGNRLYSQPIVFVKTATGRDAVVQFTTANSSLNVFFLDDSSHTNYFISQSAVAYAGYDDVLKSNYLPITTTAGGTSVVDIINSKFVNIFNTNIDAVHIYNQVNNDTGYVRKLIKVGNTYYRQLVGNWWFEDPKGDEEIEVHDDTQTSS